MFPNPARSPSSPALRDWGYGREGEKPHRTEPAWDGHDRSLDRGHGYSKGDGRNSFGKLSDPVETFLRRLGISPRQLRTSPLFPPPNVGLIRLPSDSSAR